LIIGTAGHIDHGKSQLVKYLTGTDPDRLKEEKERGITIELGYVFMSLPDGGLLSFIDVPGHENFIRQMVAGTATVDCFLLVVAADEGIMPQTREHLDILRLLGVQRGVVALTKCDLADPEMQDLVEIEIVELLKGSEFPETPVYRVSSLTGQGMDHLRDGLVEMALSTGRRYSGGRFRLDVDRVFILEGFGTIVAGTAVSGSVRPGQEVEIQPGGGRYRVREFRVNTKKDVPVGCAGDRISLNLAGLRKEDVSRGSCVAEPGYVQVRNSLDTSLTMLAAAEPIKRYQRVRFHTGTAEVMARAIPVEGDMIAPGTTGFAHFQLESPVAALPDDRFVIRSYSPVITIGGGRILETGTRKVRRKYSEERVTHLEVLETGDPESILGEVLSDAGREGITVSGAAAVMSRSSEEVLEILEGMVLTGSAAMAGSGSSARVVDGGIFREACRVLEEGISDYHRRNPVSPGVMLSEPTRILGRYPQWIVRTVIDHLTESGRLQKRGDRLSVPEHPEGIPQEHRREVESLLERIAAAGPRGMEVDSRTDPSLVRALLEREMLLELSEGLLVTSGTARELMERVRDGLGGEGFSLAELRDFMGVSRKDALRWAELFDGRGWTTRRKDRRYFRVT